MKKTYVVTFLAITCCLSTAKGGRGWAVDDCSAKEVSILCGTPPTQVHRQCVTQGNLEGTSQDPHGPEPSETHKQSNIPCALYKNCADKDVSCEEKAPDGLISE